MRTFQQVSGLRIYLRGIRAEGKTIGFVPTMGALHDGHLSLMRRARNENDLVIASIFVNPTQFGAGEDFEKYPRDLNKDLQMTSLVGVDAIFSPSLEEVYPPTHRTFVEVEGIGETLEGKRRPGHFRGVATVVAKLLNMVQPDSAYFGQKDYQQFLVIERMARDLNLPMSIIMAPTMRESDGLAMSSRNAYLSPEQRKAATILHEVLLDAQRRVDEGETSAARLRSELEAKLAREPLAVPDYVAIGDPDTLDPLTTLEGRAAVVALAVCFGTTRLIDNAVIAPPGVTVPKMRVSKPQ